MEALHSRIDSVDFNDALDRVDLSNQVSAVTSQGELAWTAVSSSETNRICPRLEFSNCVQLLVLN